MPSTLPGPAAPRSATDPTGSVLVTVDATGRVDGVQVARLDDDLRAPDALDVAVRSAYLAAVVTRREGRSAELPRATHAGPRPPRIVLTHPWREGREITMSDHEQGLRTVAVRPGRVSGTSDNECVTVTLGPGSSSGTVTADPGWLQRVDRALLGSALTQAFDHAYRKRDGR